MRRRSVAAVAWGVGLSIATGLAARPRVPAPDRPRALARYNELLATGTAAFAQGAYQTAAGRFEEAQRLLPQHPTAYLEAAQACIAWGEFDRAGEHLRAAVRRRPSWPRDPEGLARLRRRPRILEQREAQLAASLERSRSLDRLFVKGTLAYIQGERDAARLLFEEAHAAYPQDLPTRLFLASLRTPGASGAGDPQQGPSQPSAATPGGPAASETGGWMGR